MADISKIKEELDGLTLLEAAELVKMLEESWGVSAAAPVAVAAAPGGAPAGDAPAEEEQTEFDVMLTDIGGKKIQVIKAVRGMTDLGLKEAKALVESTPVAVLEGVSKEEADEAVGKFEAEGAKAEVK